ncbi:ABC transporter ATP-binding protein [Curtobacterium sp. MCPF17_047]|uniref:ABC transporter ATP-binding protein n=1 Tax=unclassified Curtobacterium TaxID=257496 RepID=UPI000DA87E02|nr:MULTISPECIES: ABC transporter ATP-binding protein [unclassified Curtobacterium]PZE56983.1 ABC transporter ATP-binding protein [Curtobacterium sp. MCPF17_001]PZF63985.1 ABC transporter ATP-binding protein [Curtobacterium sp. MCPF17_047]
MSTSTSTSTVAITADVVCRDLVRIFRTRDVEVQALQGLNLVVRPGEMVAVVGASGSGKSTLLTILSGLDAPSAGQAVVAGVDIGTLTARGRTAFHRTGVGFVWQQTTRNLIAYLTVQQNVAAVLTIAGVRGRPRAERVEEVLDLVGMRAHGDRLPGTLPGGLQQLAALAVALANRPRVLLADEPTGALDRDTATAVLAAMRAVNEHEGVTVLIVTHDQDVAEQVRRTVRIRDGRTSTETIRDDVGRASGEEFAVIDDAGRLQLPESFQVALGLRDLVRLTLEDDHVAVHRGDADATGLRR